MLFSQEGNLQLGKYPTQQIAREAYVPVHLRRRFLEIAGVHGVGKTVSAASQALVSESYKHFLSLPAV